MTRIVVVIGLVATLAAFARADIGPPKGMKRVVVDNKITTEKEFPDYQFFTVVGGGRKGDKATEGITAVKLDAKTPIVVPGAGRNPGIGRMGYLVAVPKEAEKNYSSQLEFYTAIRADKVPGQLRSKTNLDAITTVKDSDTRTTVVQEFKLEKVDAKDGIVLTRVKDADPKDKQEDSDDLEPMTPAAFAPRGGTWIAGLAASLGVALAGLWLVTRSRRGREVAA